MNDKNETSWCSIWATQFSFSFSIMQIHSVQSDSLMRSSAHTAREKYEAFHIFSYSFTISLGKRATENDRTFRCPCYCFQFPINSQTMSTWYNVQEKYLILDQAWSTRFGVGIGQETFQRCPLYSPGNKYVLLKCMFYRINIWRLQVRYH